MRSRQSWGGLLMVLILVGLFVWDPGRLWRPGAAPNAMGTDRPAGQPGGLAVSTATGEADGASNPGAPSDPIRRAVPAGLWIQVIDSEGRPVPGMPVGLALGREDSHPCWEGVTGGDEGLVEVRIPENTLHENFAGETPPFPAFAFLSLPFSEALPKTFDLASPPAEPIRLLLPPTGQVVVRVTMEDVGPLPCERWVILLGHGKEKARWPMQEERPLPRGQEELLFEHVGLGLDLFVGVGTIEFAGRGPTEAGETVRFELAVPACPVLVGRLRDVEGGLIQDVGRLDFEVRSGSFRDSGSASLDGEGGFRLELEPMCVGIREMRLVLTDFDHPPRLAYAEHPWPLHVGENSLGDLVLRPSQDLTGPWEALLASGEVTDPEGRPLEGVEIEVFEKLFWAAGNRHFWDSQWDECSDASGRFQVVGWSESEEIRLRTVSKGIGASLPITVQKGTRNVRLVLHREGVIEGSLRLDPGLSRREIELFLRRGGAPWQRIDDLDWQENEFRFSVIPAGTVDLELRLRPSGESLARIEGIDVAPGETVQDPRLQGIDLRGSVRPVEVTIGLSSGRRPMWILVTEKAKEGAALRVLNPHTGSSSIPHLLHLGRNPLDLIVQAEGHAPLIVRDVQAECRIDLDRGEEIVLRLAPSIILPGGRFRLEAALAGAGVPDDSRVLASFLPIYARFDRAGIARLRVPSLGEHELDLQLVFEGEGRIARRRVPTMPARVAAGMGQVQVRPQPEALARGVEELGTR